MNVCPNSILRSLHTVLPHLLKPSITFACLRPFLFCYSNLTNQFWLAILLSSNLTNQPRLTTHLANVIWTHLRTILGMKAGVSACCTLYAHPLTPYMNPPVLDNLKWVGNTATDDLASHNNLETQPLPPLQPSFFLSVSERCLYPEHPPHTSVYDWRHVSLQHTGCMYNGCSGEFNTSSPQPRLSPKHAFLWCTRLKRLPTIQK